jgi:hypothetical protein
MICAKYPEGVIFNPLNSLRHTGDRTDLALSLGCLACPYQKTELATGESARQAIVAVSSHNLVTELEQQLATETPDPDSMPPIE